MPLVALDLVPQPRHWKAPHGSWTGNVFEVDSTQHGYVPVLTSPDFELEADRLVTFSFAAYFSGAANHWFHIVETSRSAIVHSRLHTDLEGERRLSLAFRAPKGGTYRLVIEQESHPQRARTTIAAPSLLVQVVGDGPVRRGRLADVVQVPGESEHIRYLPHWNALQRFVHRRCRASRRFNNLVAAIEMRLEREELLSLPQYMGLCPTGQCNAMCDFCSVTINRTGIIKKQLPFERLRGFLGPVANTIQLYGIEGNGEPTLYTRFPELVETLTRGGAKAYLITNGSQLALSDVPLLLALESVNFSLNAATAQTHRQVMKLKNFDEIVAVIRALSRQRGRRGLECDPEPAIYATCVVTDDNVHEVQEFVRLAEHDFGVDVVMVRPLSELGNELGTVEDLRRIVPFESDVHDMIESVEEYMREVPGRMKIRLSPETFRSSRPDPVGRVVMPRGFEGRLLAPRRNDWIILDPQAAVVWGLNRARIVLPAASGPALRSGAIPVEPSRELVFKTRIGLTGGPVRLMVVDDQRRTVAEVALADTNGRMIPLDLPIEMGQAAWLSIVIAGEGAPATMDVDFERLRKPAPFVSDAFHIPPSRRWEACAPDAAIGWDEATLTVRSPTGGRPYLLKSYAIPCPRRALVEIPVFVGVARGAIEIGVLDASSAAYLQSFGFAEGADACVIFFNTGENDAVRLVVSAAPNQPVEATVQWRTPRIVPRAEIGADPVGPPGASQWAACAPGLQVGREGDSLSLTWRGAGSPYLLKSNKIRCRAGDRVKVAMAVEVSEGQLAVGVVGDGGAAWLAIRILDEGAHRVELEFDTGANDELSFVVTAVDGESVAARVWLSEPGFGQTPAAATPAGGAFARPNLEPAAVVAEFRIPPGARWGRCTAEAKVDWRGDALGLSSTTGGRPYLLKSPAIRCPRDSVVEIPVQVEVSHGMIEINALNPSGRVNLASFRFCEGRTATAVFFNTRSNEAIRLGISAAPDRPVDATIRWGKPALVREGDGDAEPIRLPSAPQWAACVPAASLRREGDRLFLSWRGAGSPYLLKSNKIRCRPGRPASARAVIDVTEGPLNIGLLDARDASWLITRTLGAGMHQVGLDFDPGSNEELSFVLFAADGASVEASVVLAGGGPPDAFASASTKIAVVAGDGEPIEGAPVGTPPHPEVAVIAAVAAPARHVSGSAPLEGATPAASASGEGGVGGASADGGTRPDRLLRQVGNWLSRGGARYYCQKPWTDMNNFTVDGRMDVCCIATGASQEAYQIGNLNRQNFQDIWNGPVARKFRRTVNSANKLPPCARCPMSYAYQGFLFDPAHTRDATVGRVANRLAKTKLARCGPYVSKMGDYLVNRVLFRGFKR